MIFGLLIAVVGFYLAYDRREWWYVIIACAGFVVLEVVIANSSRSQYGLEHFTTEMLIMGMVAKCIWGFGGYALGTLAVKNRTADPPKP